LGTPIRIRGQITGFLNVDSTELGFFSWVEAERLLAFADQAALAIENARLYSQARQEIAERIQAEETLRLYQQHLEELVAERTTDLVEINKQLQQEITERQQVELMLRQYTTELQARNEELDAFAHTVAHDLKNPLGALTGIAEILEDSHATLSPQELTGYLQAIARSGRKANAIIEELLLLAGLRYHEVPLMPLDMAEIVSEVQQRLESMIDEYQADIILPSTWPLALGYGPWIEEVWVNYLSNAMKYGGRPPRLELGATVQPDGLVRFWVHDNGPGLKPEEQVKLFTPFTRLQQTQIKGHGLGLSIVQRIVEKLGGQTGVESEGVPGRGSTFYFTLPAAEKVSQLERS
jgi:signal transduction histidine kinase